MAVHLSQVLSSGGVPAFNIDVVVNSSDFDTAEHTVYNFEPGGIATTYSLLFNDDCSNDTFSIQRNTGELKISQPVEFSVEDQQPVCVRTSLGYVTSIRTYSCFTVIENLSHSYGVNVVINVVPHLSNSEIRFQQEFYSSEVMEGVQGAALLSGSGIQAVTLPLNNLLTPTYRLLSGHGPFVVSEHMVMCDKFLQIHTTQALDREIRDYYEITVEAYASQTSSSTIIKVYVLDRNDEAPVFLSQPSTSTVNDGLLHIGESVTHFQAADDDSGLNAKLLYSLTSLSSPFSINPFTGSLFRYSPHSLTQTTQTVRVSDAGNPQHEILANITIFTDGKHQQPPVIHDVGMLVASESELINHVVSNLHITYSSLSDIHVSLESLGCDCFKLSNLIENPEGEYSVDLQVKSPLNFESFPDGITITITAMDVENPTYTNSKEFSVTITDENEPPVFTQAEYRVTVLEGIPIGSEIYKLAAVDPDSGSNGELLYSFISVPQNIPFSLNPSNGIVYSVSSIDYESITSIELTVTAEDGGGETDSATLQITILDRNDQQPSFTNSELAVSIPETVLANESIFHFAASDGDSQCNGAVSYSIVHAEPPVFRIDSVSGLLYPLDDDSIDFEQFHKATLIIRATDLGAHSSEFTDTTLLIHITDVNDERPQMSNIRCPCFMIEGMTTTQTCQQLSAYDADSTSLTFSIKSGNEQNYFTINPETGVVSTEEVLSFQEKDVYILEIVALDEDFEPDSEILRIVVVDRNNDQLKYTISPIEFESPTDTPIGALVGNVSVQHNDTGYNALTEYALLAPSMSNVLDVLRLDTLSGRLYLKSNPADDVYDFSVSATDILDSSNSATASVTVTFSGLRNNPPYFRSSINHITIASNSQTGTIYTIAAVDDDDEGSNGVLSYSLTTPSDFFTVQSGGALVLTQSLSDQVESVFTLSVLVSDGGDPPMSDGLQLVITVYESTVNLGGQIFQHNPGLGVRHVFANILEGTAVSLPVSQLPETEGGSVVQYTILEQGEFFNAFMLHNQNEVRSEEGYQNIFDRTQNEAVFITLRAQYGSNFHHLSLTVVIDDKNNNGPEFEEDEYSVEIYRSTPQGSFIFELNAHDPDIGSNAITNYAITNMDSIPFAIVQNTGFLEVVSDLEESIYSITIVATDSESDVITDLPSATATLTVTILETTNHPPSIDPDTYPVSEGAPIGTVVDSLIVTDSDNGIHGDNTICIASGDVQDNFRVNQNGDIIVQNQLDYETARTFTLTVMAYDSSPNPKSITTQITITVKDENEAPVFSPERYFATIVENNSPNTPVLRVSAFDVDDGSAGDVEYSILNDTSTFSIHPDTGVVSTLFLLNRESMSEHSFTVAATDKEGSSSVALLLVSVLDENDNDPTFLSPNFVIVNEATPVDTPIFQLQAVDNDNGGNGSVMFEIVSGNEDHIFLLDPFTGSLTLSRLLDYETDPQTIEVEFRVSDLGMPPRTSSVIHQITFSIENANDNFPIFSSPLYTCSIREGSNDSCQVDAHDADADSTTYDIISGSVGNAFRVDPQTGKVVPQTVIDRETVSRYALKVRATDSGSPSLSSYTVILVEVEDENDDLPKFDPIIAPHIPEGSSRLSELYFSELLPHNTLLFFAHAVDSDAGENGSISYHITNDDSDLFHIDSNTSAVFLQGSFDFETAQSHELTIEATNPSGTSTSHLYTINILNKNENLFPPVFSLNSPPAISVSEIASIGTPILNVTATDAEPGPGGEISYYLIGGSGYGYFTIDQLQGGVSVSYALTGIETLDVTLEIVAVDLGLPPLSSTYTLVVNLEPDSGAKPFFTTAHFVAFAPEPLFLVGNIFTSVQASVNDLPGSDVTYCIVSGNEDNRFSINASTGAISVANNLDRERESMYTLLVNASRSSSSDASIALVAITVADSNDFRPTFPVSYDVTIFNNHPTGLSNAFMRVFAVDEDIGENSRLEYSIASGGTNIFAIDPSSGDIYLTQSLPTTGNPSYTVSVNVTDMGSLPLPQSTTFTVSVTAPASTINNMAPSFTSSSTVVEIPEDATPGLLVYTAQATDSSGEHLVYKITESLPSFAVMPNSGEVYLIKSLDREQESQYTIKIEASDGSLSSSVFLLNVVVTDVNDNRPLFTSEEFVFTAVEHSDNGENVGHLTADDIDDTNTITYTLVDSKNPGSMELFSLTADGLLQVAGTIDRETLPVHVLTVAAEDDGNPALMSFTRVKVIVTDINDHAPAFISPLQNVSIPENTSIGTPFFNVSVFDPDTGVRGTFTYTLVPDTAPFAINESTGELYVAVELDAEEQTSYSLVITVADRDNPLMTATTTLQVNVIDVLDSLPVLTNPGTITLAENMPPYTIVALVADRVNLSPVYYDIISGNDENHFFIEPLTGIVRTAVPLDRETTTAYSLTVQGAFEQNYKASVTFTVVVSDENDQAPTFSGQFLKYTLPENSRVSEFMLRLNFTDEDEGSNSLIGGYYIPDPEAAEVFNVDSAGNLRILEPLDREGKFDAIGFELYIFDSGSPPLYDLARLSITVSDVNDNPPHFLQSSYNFIVSLPVLVDTVLFEVQAADLDEDATIRYAIIGGNGTEKFSMNAITGGISITDNYKLQPYYSLTVSAKDEGDLETNVSVNITTKECGFNSLLFDPRDISERFSENTTTGTVVFQPNILTFDIPPTPLQYSFSTIDPLFQIDNSTGLVRIRSSLDREQQSTHRFSVQARDISNPNRIAQADIEMIVTDVNDNAPMFQSAPYVVYITNDHSGEILRVRALDEDEGTNGEVNYRLLSGGSGVFGIEENTGQISLLSALDTSMGTHKVLSIEATDRGEPQMSETTTVTVNIVDSNAPLFTMSGGYSAQVNESAPRNTEVITVTAEATSMNPVIRYNIESTQSATLPFSIDFVEGLVTVNGIGLDYETNSSYRLNLEAIDLTTSLVGRATLDIEVLDVNDNRPEFSKALYQSSVMENSDVGTSVEEVSARDLDSGANSNIAYSIDPNDIATTLFNIHEDTGLITTSVVIDREQNNFFQFSVLAKDAGNPSLTGTTTVQIEILDVNDNAPTFLESSYHGTISEDDSNGTSILFVSATDADDNSIIQYDIVPSLGSSNFGISSGGLLTLTTAVSELSEFQYVLTISAFDTQFYGYTEVTIELEDANNHAPVFNETTYIAYIIENATVGATVTQVFAADADRGSNAELTYSMSSNQFAINPETGIISVIAELDRESSPNGVMLIVIARDGGGRTGTAEIIIELGDVNDNPPTFSSLMYRFDVLESDPIGTTVSTSVTATDPDDGSNGSVHYSITETGDPNQFPFEVDEISGTITTKLIVDPNFQDEYIFTVNAVDGGTPAMTANPSTNVTIQVIPDGEMPPRFENGSYQISIMENNQYGEVILTPTLVFVNQTVECDIILFSLIQSADMFQIYHDSNNIYATIRVTAILNREESATHTFLIQADCLPVSSPTLVSSHALVTVIVLDENEPPLFSSFFLRGSIAENIALSSILQLENNMDAVEATDEDIGENGVIRYEIQDDVPFSVDPISGIISVSGELDREMEDSYRFNVIAEDLGNPPLSDSIRIVVTIEDINDSPPIFDQSVYYREVLEGVAINTRVITVTASDADLDEFAVSIYSVSGSDAFSIDNTTGELIVVSNLDRETTPSYTLQVSATDGVHQRSTSVEINITDINDNPPIFNDTQYEIKVDENYATGVPILQVSATDKDLGENAEISFGILEDQQLIHVNISTGEISFSQRPDYEVSPHYELRVIAMNTNDENLRAFATLIIDLEDLNDNAPMFSEQTDPIEVSENRFSGITVVRVVAEDLDSGSNARVQYELSQGALEYFTIDSQTGIIRTRMTFDREINSSFELSVTATDSGIPPLSSNTSLSVIIADINDNPPVFSQDNYTVIVPEGVDIGSVIQTIRAEDADEGTNAEITIRLTGDNSAHFIPVKQEDGSFDIQVAQMLNRENIAEYDLSITAFDGGFPFLQMTADLTIIVQDVNDNPPEFDPPFYTIQLSENATVGSEITRVHARDPDSAEITQLTYSIRDSESHSQFEIDVLDGRVLLVEALDFEEEQVHIFIVQADDQIHVPATASVILTVTNVNDNAPEFAMTHYTTSVTENTPGRELFDFSVHDRDIDSDPNTISFRIESGNTDEIFAIDTTSGSLTVKDYFDFEILSTSEYLLIVTASDNEDPPLAGTAYVTVTAQDTNDNAPVGEDQVFNVFLYNGQLALQTLGKLLIRDPDTVNDYVLEVSGDESVFSIELGDTIDIVQYPPPPGVYSFTVNVTDGNFEPVITRIDITVVNITDAHLANSFTMQVDSNSVLSFLDNHLQYFLSTIEDLLTDKASIRNPKAYVFNITSSQERRTNIDLSIVVQSGDGDIIHPNLVQHILHVNRDDIEENLELTIVTENVDHCADESLCPLGTVCTIAWEYSSSRTVLGSAAASLLGIDRVEHQSCSKVSFECSISCPESSYCAKQGGHDVCIDNCTPNPCKNNGKCQDQMPGYYCSCPSGFDGRNCELTTSYFQEDSYAVLPAVATLTNGTIALEFTAAEGAEGLLYYSSRFDDSERDFLALEVISGHLSLVASYGAETMRVSVRLDGGDGWYTAVVEYSSSVSVTTEDKHIFTNA